jgi:hypothetical protein
MSRLVKSFLNEYAYSFIIIQSEPISIQTFDDDRDFNHEDYDGYADLNPTAAEVPPQENGEETRDKTSDDSINSMV